ncbi:MULTISPECIES: MotA/TolQ/ExbB proton channel family protein [unclassified Capnocytophaga]|jgi:Biopolymer transport proteins|uniref:MotA/TolQ/ExbB proton channel family protein n=1 Tax=unclassified Capnocytophaga TaxID=2640652 RepID=UPI00058F3C73|nr:MULTISPECIES: MotA/TolQ/ExbB proton channel family protein [unclassified Capnocytophaga]MEB3004448.1 MotA/TolQ/ExbB proton channel family protein [Capnocytophaga sp. G2]
MLFLQTNPLTEGTQPTTEMNEESLSIMQLIFDGGLANTIIIGILFLMLATALYIYFERTFAIGAAKRIDTNFMNVIRDNISSGRIDAAKNLCYQYNSPVARLVSKGLSRIGKPIDDIRKAIENAGSLEVYKLEKNVSLLATLAGVGPMIGFLGTVVGMVMSFHAMATSGGQADMTILAGGIYTAMTTTVAGLIVGIVAYLAYNHLVMRINNVTQKLEATTVDFLDMLNEPV